MLTVLREQEKIWQERLMVDVDVTSGLVRQLGDKLIAKITQFEAETLARLDREGYAEIAAKVRSNELTAKAASDQVQEIDAEEAEVLL